MATPSNQAFKFPKLYAYPPMWSIQRVLATRQRQFKRWSGIILAYCRHSRIWRLNLVEALDTPLFRNTDIKKWLTLEEVHQIIDWMTGEEGLKRAEWVGGNDEKTVAWIYWRRPEEWAEVIANWVINNCRLFAFCKAAKIRIQVEETGQRNTVLTLYELTQGESTTNQGLWRFLNF
jgi:ESCRT-II complex subunit VPS25